MTKVNPFKPNSPVPTAMFAGRTNEIQAFEKGLMQTKNNNPTHFLLTGERGIGKSSLLMLFKPMATGAITSYHFGSFKFLSANIVVSPKMNLLTIIKMIERNLKREIGKVESLRNFFSDSWDFVQRIKVLDSGIDKVKEIEDIDLVIDDFSYSLAETSLRLSNPNKGETAKDGIVIFIDEADNSSPELQLGYFLKTVTEQLQINGCDNVMFVVAGLPVVIDKLTESHESSLRIFHPMQIKELSPPDRQYVIDKGMEEANRNGESKITIAASAKQHISTLSEGYPHFIQQFAYCAFDANDDGEISDDDVLKGAFTEGGAIDCIGTRYYAAQYHAQIKSDEYREVLCIMADNMNSWVKKSDIRSEFSGSDQTLNNAIQALTKRKIILKNTSKIGEYRLQQRGFALWIKLFGQRTTK
ncbi:Orc1-like AAA ATPase domain-containing protein [Vibrio crassostreae]|nr:Orc1-like AAA ATPase domain-containing protein [Vibrio crassostreae]